MKLKEIYESANTGLDAIKRAPILDYETNLRCIRIQDISQSKEFKDWGYTETTLNDYKKFKLKKDDILVARTGATVGVSYIVKNECEAVFNNGTIRLRLKHSVNPNFIYYIFQSREFRQYIQNVSCVSTQPNLKVENLLRFEIPEYDKFKQDCIVNVLLKYDEFIENNNKKISILEQMAEEIYKNSFTYHKIKCNSEEKKLEDIVGFQRGISYSSEEIDCEDGNNLINLKNINAYGGFRRDGIKKYNGKYKESQVVNAGDLIMGVTDMTQDRRTVGYVALIPTIDGISVISADLVKINSKIDNTFLYAMFKYGNLSKNVSQFANGANVLHLKPQAICNIKIQLPCEELIDKYVKTAKPIFEEIDSLNLQNDNLITQRDLLLPRLMSGKLEMK